MQLMQALITGLKLPGFLDIRDNLLYNTLKLIAVKKSQSEANKKLIR
jgi:hypothetical protein